MDNRWMDTIIFRRKRDVLTSDLLLSLAGKTERREKTESCTKSGSSQTPGKFMWRCLFLDEKWSMLAHVIYCEKMNICACSYGQNEF